MMSFNRFRAAGWYQRRPIGFTVKLSNKSQPHPSFFENLFAQQVGVRRETIVFSEKGKYNPSLKLAYEISKAFNLPIESVFIFENPVRFW